MQSIRNRLAARNVNRAIGETTANIQAVAKHLQGADFTQRKGDPVLTPMPDYVRRRLWRSYVVVGRGFVRVLVDSFKTIDGWVALVPSVLVFFNQPIFQTLSLQWSGIDRRWAAVPIVLLMVHLAIKQLHNAFETIKEDAHNTKKKLGDIDLRLRLRSFLRMGRDMAEWLERRADECTPDGIEECGKRIREWGVVVSVHLGTAEVYLRHFNRTDLMLYREGGDNRIRDMVRFVEQRCERLEEALNELERI